LDYNSLDDADKKKIARQASAAYILLPHAVREYIRLTGIIELLPEQFREEPPYKNIGDGAMPTIAYLFYGSSPEQQNELQEKMPDYAEAAKIYRQAEEEMLSLLPKYRHPVYNTIFLEPMIFFAGNINTTMTGYTGTPLMVEVKKSVPEPMRSKILQELEAKELLKGKLATITQERDDILGVLDDARKEYQPLYPKEPINKRQKRAIRKLGFSEKKRTQTFKPNILYKDYVTLVRRKNFDRDDAVQKVAKLHGIAPSTVLKELHKERARIKKILKAEYSLDQQKYLLPYLTKIIPPNR